MITKTRALGVLAVTASVLLATALPAAAAAPDAANEGWSVTDSHGIPGEDFRLAMWAGNAWDAAKLLGVWNMLMSIAWEVYRVVVTFTISLLEWTLQLEWVDWILTPLKGLEKVTGTFMDQMGLMPLMLLVLALVVGWWILKGRFAGGLVELAIGCVVAALAVGFLSQPMDLIAGKGDGMLYQARDAGQEVATAVATDGRIQGGATDDQSQGTVSSLTDTLIRLPHQIINYGSVIDGTSCESVYDEALTSGDDLDEIRETIGACDEAYKEFSDAPDVIKTFDAFNLWFVGGSFGLLSIALVVVFVLAVLGAGWQAVKLVVLLVIGIMPGGARASLMRSASNAAFALIMVAASSVFITVWMELVKAFFAESEALPFVIRVRLFALMLLIGAVVLFVFRQKVKKALHRIGDRLAQLGASSATHEPSKLPGQLADRAYQMWLHKGKRRPATTPAHPVEATPTTKLITKPDTHTQGPRQLLAASPTTTPPRLLGPGTGGPSVPPTGAGPKPPWAPKGPFFQPAAASAAAASGPSKALVLRSRLGTVAKVAAHGGTMIATGGSSAAITGAKAAVVGVRAGAVARAGTAAVKAGAVARTSTTALKASKAARAGTAVVKTAKTTRAVTNTTRAITAAREARSDALRAKLTEARMGPHRIGMVDRSTGVTYRQHSAAGTERVEIYKPTGIDPSAIDATDEMHSRLRPARMPAQRGER